MVHTRLQVLYAHHIACAINTSNDKCPEKIEKAPQVYTFIKTACAINTTSEK